MGTITEIYDYLRVLYARVGQQHCPTCQNAVGKQEPAQIVETVMELPVDTRILVLAPLARQRKGTFAEAFAEAQRDGFVRARVNGEVIDLQPDTQLDKKRKHDVDLVVDRAVVRPDEKRRLADSIEMALKKGQGKIVIAASARDGAALAWSEKSFSEALFCDECALSFAELSPLTFSFNSPLGACEGCKGLGFAMQVDPEAIIPDDSKSLRQGAIAPWGGPENTWSWRILEGIGAAFGLDLDKPWRNLSKEHQQLLLHGTTERVQVAWQGKNSQGSWAAKVEGAIPQLQRRWKDTGSEQQRAQYQQYFVQSNCPDCRGKRLKPDVSAVRVAGKTLPDLVGLSVEQAHAWIETMPLVGSQAQIAVEVRKEILSRLRFLLQVGLGYLSLNRGGATLSGGESQRIRLASQVGSELTGVLYILDEPSIGLHPRDSKRLVKTLEHLRDLGNTVLVVEHDDDTIRSADHLVDFGPGAGKHGGMVVAQGTLAQICAHPTSRTGGYLSGRLAIDVPVTRRKPQKWLTIFGAATHNLRAIDVALPTGTFCAVTGVSGAGKSTLVHDILLPAMHNSLIRGGFGGLPRSAGQPQIVARHGCF